MLFAAISVTITGVLEIFVCISGVGMLLAAISVTIVGVLEIFVCILAVGMLFAAVSVTIAGVLEIFRLKNVEETGGFVQIISGTAYNASHFSIFLQVPQFVWIGAGEVFTSITS